MDKNRRTQNSPINRRLCYYTYIAEDYRQLAQAHDCSKCLPSSAIPLLQVGAALKVCTRVESRCSLAIQPKIADPVTQQTHNS